MIEMHVDYKTYAHLYFIKYFILHCSNDIDIAININDNWGCKYNNIKCCIIDFESVCMMWPCLRA